jgi:hypothetical protein
MDINAKIGQKAKIAIENNFKTTGVSDWLIISIRPVFALLVDHNWLWKNMLFF